MMRKAMLYAAPSLLAALSTLPAPAAAAPDILSGYEKTGETETCLIRRLVRDQDVVDDYSILFETAGRTVYLNELNGRCIGLGREQRFIAVSPETRMCAGQIITVIDNFGNAFGSCSLGKFQELSKIEQEQEPQEEEDAP